ncbi:MAG: class I SAM-dependent methyltransferase [Planctomycetota bacterium]
MIDQLLTSYPRPRPPLPDGQAAIYEAEYKRNRQGGDVASGAAQKLEAWMHRAVARDSLENRSDNPAVLELGAGTLNHLPHEPGALPWDIVEPQRHLFEDSPHRGRLRDEFADLVDVPGGRRYGRIVSIAVLEHIEDLPTMLARCGLLLEEGGVMQHGIPSEGGLLWGLAWRLSTGLSYRLRTGFSYKTLMRHEHVSGSEDILAVARHFFDDVRHRRFPLPLRHGSFYTYFLASAPRVERCRAWLKS